MTVLGIVISMMMIKGTVDHITDAAATVAVAVMVTVTVTVTHGSGPGEQGADGRPDYYTGD